MSSLFVWAIQDALVTAPSDAQDIYVEAGGDDAVGLGSDYLASLAAPLVIVLVIVVVAIVSFAIYSGRRPT